MLLITKAMDWNSIHIFHHQIQVAILSNTAIHQVSNERVLQPGENLTFLTKPLPEEVGCKRQIDQFDSDLLLKLPIGAVCQIDGAHAAASQQAIQHERTDALESGYGVKASFRFQAARCRQSLFCFASFEQRPDLGREFHVAMTSGFNQFHSRFNGSHDSFVENRFGTQEPFSRFFHLNCDPACGL